MSNFFRTCGFGKAIDKQVDDSFATIEIDSQWHRLSTIPDDQLPTFEEFVSNDDILAVCGSFIDDAILNKADDKRG